MEIAITTPDYIGRVEKHLIGEFSDAVEQWADCIRVLTNWEDDHLLDNPTEDNLAIHRKTVERLIRFGKFISLATAQPEFPDRQTADIVQATQQVLSDKLRLWHSPKIAKADSDKILREAFLDEP